MATTSQTDMSVGLGLLFSALALGAAVATGVFGYGYSIQHADVLQTSSGLAFAAAMLAAALAIAAIHVYDN